MKFIGKTLLCAVAFIVATIVSGAILTALRLKPPVMPAGATTAGELAWMPVGCVVLAIGMAPLAAGLGGRFPIRYAALAVLLFVANGVNQTIELTIFSTMGGQAFLIVYSLIVVAVGAAALAWLFASPEPIPSLPRMAASSWAWRVLVAWLAFPVIYLAFGMCVGPFVIGYYKSGAMGLQLPSMDVILRTQLLRSLLFLACSLPVIRLWTGSRRRLIFALGLAHAALVGLYGLSTAYFLPAVMRTLHSVEITADSFVYVLVLGLLFFPRTRTAVASTVTSAPITTAA